MAGGGSALELRFALLGCGDIGPSNVAALSRARGCRLVCIVDVNPEGLAQLSPEHQAIATTDPDRVLERSDIDCVFIATPHDLHAPLTCRAAEKRKHVVVEKPMACTLAEADRMIEHCQAHGVALSICHPRRYDDLVALARELVSAGRIGAPRMFRSSFFRPKGDSYWEGGTSGRIRSPWRKSRERSGGGVLMMNGVNQIDTLLSCVQGEVVRVHATLGNLGSPADVEDTCVLTLEFQDGSLGLVEASTLKSVAKQIEDQIIGSGGLVVVRPKVLEVRTGENGGRQVEVHERTGVDLAKRRFLEEFAAAVLAGQPPPVPADYGRRILGVVTAAYRSHEEKRAIEV